MEVEGERSCRLMRSSSSKDKVSMTENLVSAIGTCFLFGGDGAGRDHCIWLGDYGIRRLFRSEIPIIESSGVKGEIDILYNIVTHTHRMALSWRGESVVTTLVE